MIRATVRPTSEQLITFMRSVKHLGQADEQVLREAETQSEWQILPSREILMRQGDEQASVYLLLSGKLRYERRDPTGSLLASGEMLPGDLVGDVSMLKDRLAVATVFSVRDSQLMSLPGASFQTLLLKSPSVLLSLTSKILQQVERGLAATTQRSRSMSFAVIPLDQTVPMATFIHALRDALAHQGRAICITRRTIESHLGSGRADLTQKDALFSDNLRWLSHLEAEHEFILFEAECDPTPWSLQCVRHADRLIFVGMGRQVDAKPTPFEQWLAADRNELSPPRDLVLLHDEQSRPAHTDSFLASRQVARHHHIWLERKAGFERLARALAGRSIGLVLGGGGVRAAAHIGLIRAFEEEGIPIDHIGGTSIGALVGALFAKGFSTTELEEIIATQIVRTNLFNDYIPPVISLVRGRKFSQFLHELIGDDAIEDLPLDYFSVTTNLTANTLEVWDRGSAWKAVRASASLPGILPPFAKDGNLYLDGGLVDNVPEQAMRHRGAGLVIASDVSAPVQCEGDTNFEGLVRHPGTAPSFWKFVRGRMARPREIHPGIGDIISRSMVIGSRERLRHTQATADIFIRLPVDKWKMLDFKSTSELVGVGYRYARAHLPEWRAKLTTS